MRFVLKTVANIFSEEKKEIKSIEQVKNYLNNQKPGCCILYKNFIVFMLPLDDSYAAQFPAKQKEQNGYIICHKLTSENESDLYNMAVKYVENIQKFSDFDKKQEETQHHHHFHFQTGHEHYDPLPNSFFSHDAKKEEKTRTIYDPLHLITIKTDKKKNPFLLRRLLFNLIKRGSILTLYGRILGGRILGGRVQGRSV